MRTPPAYGELGFSKRQATALINGVFFYYTLSHIKYANNYTLIPYRVYFLANTIYGKETNERREVAKGK